MAYKFDPNNPPLGPAHNPYLEDYFFAPTENKVLMHDGTDFNTVVTDHDKKINKIERHLEKILERLAILDEPDPEMLENHKMLKDAYTKYKFIEELIGKKNGK